MSIADNGRLDLRGIYFGYPSCCIEEYYPGKPESKGFEGTGFACCTACIKKPVREVLDEISTNRVCGLEFPRHYQGEGDYDSKYYNGLLFRVLLYRELSNQPHNHRLEVINHYENEVAESIAKILASTDRSYELNRTLDLMKEMSLALRQCKGKVHRLLGEELTGVRK